MSNTKSEKLEKQVKGLTRELDESRSAIRKLFEQQRSTSVQVAQFEEKITKLEVAFAQVSNRKDTYENTIQRERRG